MGKKTKVIIIILVIVTVILGALLLMAKVWKSEQKEVEYPKGSLVNDFFVSQNTTYKESKYLSKSQYFTLLPYIIDVPDATHGVSGNGTIYEAGKNNALYVSEIYGDYGKQIVDEFSTTVLFNADKDLGELLVGYETDGYINGYKAHYIFDKLTVSDGQAKESVYLVGYILDIPDYDYDVLICVTTSQYTTEDLFACDKYAVDVINTLRFDEKSEITPEPEIEIEEVDSFEDSADTPDEPIVEPPIIPIVPEDAIIQTEEIVVDANYTNLLLTWRWTNLNTLVELKLYDASGALFYTPTLCEGGVAEFELGYFAAGKYTMEIRGLNYGATSYECAENIIIDESADSEADTEVSASDETNVEEE